MNLLKLLGIESKEEKRIEKLKALGWEPPSIKWKLPPVLQFSLVALNEDGEVVRDWYLGTRSKNEPEGTFFLVAYGLTDVPERAVSCNEAIQLWSKWLQQPASVMPRFPMEDFKDWFKWARQDVPTHPEAEEQINDLAKCTFKISAVRRIEEEDAKSN